ncbi:hypothetical protein [Ramlibacter aurantiacus]|nr:hypothetical protein [Ramlibacter aurantiacus]
MHPTPAIVAQTAVRPLPRWALLLLCAAYVLAGFLGREPWKAQDMTAFGYMFQLAIGNSSWLAPTLLGRPPEFDALLPYWLGAWAIRATPSGWDADLSVRIVFMGVLALTLAATWWAIYHLARRQKAQPVAFAFGGEASPIDYARTMADAGLLALVACLGLGQLSHETTPALTQLGCLALAFYGFAAPPQRLLIPGLALALGLSGLALSGAPTTAVLIALGGAVLLLLDDGGDARPDRQAPTRWVAAAATVFALALGWMASELDLWRWRVDIDRDWRSLARLLVWFTWPAWPLAAWTLWRWRRQLESRHVALPLWITAIGVGSALLSSPSDRALLLALPALAALAAFALPTLSRNVSAVIDWFTLLFFTGCVLVIWVVWISLQTGVPAKPASNVYKLAPGYEPSFSLLAFVLALAGTLAWAALVRWRVGRHRSALWKSLVLPAGGAALCWLLVMTLWLPVLDYARSYVPTVRGVLRAMDAPGCVEVAGLARGQIAALQYHAGLDLREAGESDSCPWRLLAAAVTDLGTQGWQTVAVVRRPADAADTLRVQRRQPSR